MNVIKKHKKGIVISFLVVLISITILDIATTYRKRIHPKAVTVENDQISILMTTGTSLGYFKKAELKEIKEGVYRIDAYFSVLRGEYDGYIYKIDNTDRHIKELRSYDVDNPDSYVIIYESE